MGEKIDWKKRFDPNMARMGLGLNAMGDMDENYEKYLETIQAARTAAHEWPNPEPKDSYVVIIPRERWEAFTPLGLEESALPATTVYFSYLFGLYPQHWEDMDASKRSIKRLQSYYFNNKGLPDIPFSFIITSDCRIYEGRGWKYKPDVTAKGQSVIDVAFANTKDAKKDLAGTFKMVETGLQLIHFGIHRQFIDSGYYTLKRHIDLSEAMQS